MDSTKNIGSYKLINLHLFIWMQIIFKNLKKILFDCTILLILYIFLFVCFMNCYLNTRGPYVNVCWLLLRLLCFCHYGDFLTRTYLLIYRNCLKRWLNVNSTHKLFSNNGPGLLTYCTGLAMLNVNTFYIIVSTNIPPICMFIICSEWNECK